MLFLAQSSRWSSTPRSLGLPWWRRPRSPRRDFSVTSRSLVKWPSRTVGAVQGHAGHMLCVGSMRVSSVCAIGQGRDARAGNVLHAGYLSQERGDWAGHGGGGGALPTVWRPPTNARCFLFPVDRLLVVRSLFRSACFVHDLVLFS